MTWLSVTLFEKSIDFSIEGTHFIGQERLIKAKILGSHLENIVDSSVSKNGSIIIIIIIIITILSFAILYLHYLNLLILARCDHLDERL